MAVRRVGIALLGLGTIGGAVVEAVRAQEGLIADRYGFQPAVVAALERSTERIASSRLPESAIAPDLDAILDNEAVEVVVEVLGGEQPAADFMARSLAAGKHVVTANKEALSKHFGRLVGEAQASRRALLFEASVGGGIPLMVSYRQILSANRVERIRGIVNGTTNFILTQMASQGMAYADALAEAQRLGYAEPDPTNDVEGFDAAYKLAILASLMIGRPVRPDAVDRTGITGVTPQAIADARERGGTLKLIARAEHVDDRLTLRVSPEFVPNDELLAHVSANFNAIELVGDRVGPVVLTGQGAGPLPTASAILSDVVDAARFGALLNPVLVEA